jgi:hypothetical protein
MPGPSLALRSLAGWLALCVLVSVPASGGAQALSEDAVKAGFVFNFLKFTQWPPARDPHPLSLRICTTAARALDGQMALLQGRTLGERVIGITASFGIASSAQAPYQLKQLLIRADAAMYQAKQAGRDRVVTAAA